MFSVRRSRFVRIIRKLGMIAIIVGAIIAIYPLLVNFYAFYGIGEQIEEHFQEEADPALESEVNLWEEPFRAEELEEEFTTATLEIPILGLSELVIKGTSQQVLAEALGWYEESELPGKGNTAIAGHLDIHGSKFRHLHRLGYGDLITLEYRGEIYTYQVEDVFIIASTDWSVIDPTDYVALTLTTCVPGDRTRRLAVRASFVEPNE